MNTVVKDRYWLIARDKSNLLSRMMRLLAGNAHISFEGDLSNCNFPESIQRIPENDSILKRQTVWPRQDFVILSLEHDTIEQILEVVLPADRYKEDIIHIQIEKHGALQFGCYDQFDQHCIVCFLGVPTKFLDELKNTDVIVSWTTPSMGAVRGGHG